MSHNPRLKREIQTLTVMITLYCQRHHGGGKNGKDHCPECEPLLNYALARIDHCPYCRQKVKRGAENLPSGEGNDHPGDYQDKPPCNLCPIHCYRPEMRERIRQVMRWAGPRMIWRHPLLAWFHLRDGRRFKQLAGE